MASAVLAGGNELNWNERYMRNYSSNSTALNFQLNSRLNPNPNPNFNLNRQLPLSHLRQGNEPSSRALNTNVPINWKPNAVDDRHDSFHREHVTFNLASYTRRELKDLKKRLVLDLHRVQGLLYRIEARDLVSGTSIHARNAVQPQDAPQLQLNQPSSDVLTEILPPKTKVSTKKRPLGSAATGKEPKRRCVVEGDKFFASMMRHCKQILMKLMNQKNGWVFNTPVDVKGMRLYDYHDVIKHPMDLGTVKLRLERNEYRTPQDFAADVRLTFNNALTYNPRGQDVHGMAQEFLDRFERLFKPAFSKYETEHQKGASIIQQRNVLHEPLPVSQGCFAPPAAVKFPPQPAPYFVPHAVKSPPQPAPYIVPHAVESPPQAAPYFVPHDVKSPPQPAPYFVPHAVKSPPQPAPYFVPHAVKSPPTQPLIVPLLAKLPKPKAKDSNKRQMTFEEKKKLMVNLENLPQEKIDNVLQVLKRRNSNVEQDGDEVELDIDDLDNETMWELDRLIIYHKKAMNKTVKKQGAAEDGPIIQLDKSPEKAPPEHAMMKSKKGDVEEEDVDIGEEMPMECFPPVHIDKDVPCVSSGGSSSSSSSSSGSDSSSSDSDSGSSSESDSDKDSVQSPFVEAKDVGAAGC